MRARIGPVTAMLLGAAFTLTRTVMAEPPREGVRLDTFQPASPESPFFRAEGPHASKADAAVEFALGLGLEYAKAPLRAIAVDEGGSERALSSVIEHAVLTRISASISPVPWLAFDMSLPFALYEAGEARPATYGGARVAPAATQGIGDILVGLQVRPVDTDTFDLLVSGRFWAPIGSEEAYLSDHRSRVEGSVGAAGEIGPALYGCTFSVAPMFFAQRDGDRIAASCGVHAKALPYMTVGLEPTFAMVLDVLPTGEAKPHIAVEPLLAATLSIGSFRVGIGGGPAFGSAQGAAELRLLVNAAFLGVGKVSPPEVATEIADRDLDEIPNDIDACPDEAGPQGEEKTRRGCPIQDRDADRIQDADDFCPDRPGVPHIDPNANGCPDSDNDDLPDPLDKCLNEPGAAPSGCPTYARLAGGAFKLTPPIEFKDATLPAEGVKALEEIAATMRANPKFEQVSISLGTRGVRVSMSDLRAQQIILIFRAGNLDSDRYEVVLRDELKGGTVQAQLVR